MATTLELTPYAAEKVRQIMAQQSPTPLGLRLAVVGGGCSGFSYQMNFENQTNAIDKVFDFAGLKVFVDQASLMYLKGTTIDYVETLEGAGFKFENPNVKSTCGCGSSFTV
jgi:iron-sulfur cluster assembly accessory protein